MKRLAHYSQYFLRSPQRVKELIGHSSIKPSDTVYDIGAGSGTISSVLAGRAKQVIAIELEPRMADKLRENMANYANVKVLQTDFLSMPLPNDPYKIFSNIPFHISSEIVRKITQADNPPTAAYLIVQRQFGYKLVPSPDRFTGQLGIMIGPEFAVRIRSRLERSDYSPQPNVDTVMIEILKRAEPLLPRAAMPAYREFVANCFSTPKMFAKTPQKAVGLPVGIKPSELRLEQWVALFELGYKR